MLFLKWRNNLTFSQRVWRNWFFASTIAMPVYSSVILGFILISHDQIILGGLMGKMFFLAQLFLFWCNFFVSFPQYVKLSSDLCLQLKQLFISITKFAKAAHTLSILLWNSIIHTKIRKQSKKNQMPNIKTWYFLCTAFSSVLWRHFFRTFLPSLRLFLFFFFCILVFFYPKFLGKFNYCIF